MRKMVLVFLIVLFVFVNIAGAQEIYYNRGSIQPGELIWVNTGDCWCEWSNRVYDKNGYIYPHCFDRPGGLVKAILMKKREIRKNEFCCKIAIFSGGKDMFAPQQEFPIIREIPQQGVIILNY